MNQQQAAPPKACKCGVPAKAFQVKKDGPNKGRWFLSCGSGLDSDCRFFEWTVAPPPPPVPKKRGETVACAVVRDGRLAIRQGNSAATAWLRSGKLPYAVHEPSLKCWTIPLEKMGDASEKIAAGCGVYLEPLPPFVARLASRAPQGPFPTAEACIEILRGRIPDHLLATLKPFQLAGVTRIAKLGGRVMLCDEMGLGKTIQCCSSLAYFNDWPALVVCPSSLRLNWRNEFRKWLGMAEAEVQVVFSGADILRTDAKVIITSYDLASKIDFPVEFLSVVCDESHYLKNPRAQRTMALLPLLRRARRALLLTGTPALARPIEIHTSLAVLRPDLFSDVKAFTARYCAPKDTDHGVDVTGHSNLDELNWILTSTLMIRRLKKDALTELPAKLRKHLHVKVEDPGIQKELAEMLAESGVLDNKIAALEARKSAGNQLRELKTSKIVLMGRMWALTGKGKLPAARSYLADEASDPERKIIVFAHHIEVLDALHESCIELGLRPIRIDGSTKPGDRQPLCDAFQTDPSVRAAVLSLTAAGVGLTLSRADLVVFAEIAWTPALLLQAEDRAHRIGREGDVRVVYLLADGSFDEVQFGANVDKLKIVGKMVEGDAKKVGLHETTSREASPKAEATQKQIGDYFSAVKVAPVKEAVAKVVPKDAPPAEKPLHGPALPLDPIKPRTFTFVKPKENHPPPDPTLTPAPTSAVASHAILAKGFSSPLALSSKPRSDFVSAKDVLLTEQSVIKETPHVSRTARPRLLGEEQPRAAPRPLLQRPKTDSILVCASDDEEDDEFFDASWDDNEDQTVAFGDLDEALLADLLARVEATAISN